MKTVPEPGVVVFRHHVRWPEVDAQGVVFNGHYLSYLDTAVTEFWRAAGLPYPEGFRHAQGDIFVRHHAIDYLAPARLDDRLDISVWCERVGASSLTMAWVMAAQGRRVAQGQAVYVFTDLVSKRPQAVPGSLRTQLDCLAAGQAVHQIKCASWADLQDGAQAVRRAVFIEEQGIAEADEWDQDDAPALHALVSNLAGLPLATGRLITAGLPCGQAKIGRMAVLRSSRGVGLGGQVLTALLDGARGMGVQTISLHAQAQAVGFYRAFGFTAQGEPFDEVGIAHHLMQLTP